MLARRRMEAQLYSLRASAYWEALVCALCLLTADGISGTGPARLGLSPRLRPPTCPRHVSGVGYLDLSCMTHHMCGFLAVSTGPRYSNVLRFAFCDALRFVLSVNGYYPLFPLVVTEHIFLKGCDRLVHRSHSFHGVDHIHDLISRLAYVLTQHVSQTQPTGPLTFSFAMPGGSVSGSGPASASDPGTISDPSSASVKHNFCAVPQVTALPCFCHFPHVTQLAEVTRSCDVYKKQKSFKFFYLFRDQIIS